MRVTVDLNRCQSYAQCCFAAPTVFRMRGEEALDFDPAPDESLRGQIERAARACPVQAISIDRSNAAPEPRREEGQA
jgi:ferredoxin